MLKIEEEKSSGLKPNTVELLKNRADLTFFNWLIENCDYHTVFMVLPEALEIMDQMPSCLDDADMLRQKSALVQVLFFEVAGDYQKLAKVFKVKTNNPMAYLTQNLLETTGMDAFRAQYDELYAQCNRSLLPTKNVLQEQSRIKQGKHPKKHLTSK